MRYLANNEQIIEKLSQSSIMRRAAQMTVYLTLKSKSIGQSSLENLKTSASVKNLEDSTQQAITKFQSFAQRFADELKAGFEEMKKNKKR